MHKILIIFEGVISLFYTLYNSCVINSSYILTYAISVILLFKIFSHFFYTTLLVFSIFCISKVSLISNNIATYYSYL